MTVCMGYPAMPPQVGKPENAAGRGQENHVGENGTPNVNWSKWPVDVVNDAKRHSLEELSALRLTSCGHFDYMRQIGRSLNQFSYAVEWGLIHKIPLPRDAPKVNIEERTIWDEKTMLAALQTIENPALHLAVHMSMILSLREGEILGLQPSDLDFDGERDRQIANYNHNPDQSNQGNGLTGCPGGYQE